MYVRIDVRREVEAMDDSCARSVAEVGLSARTLRRKEALLERWRAQLWKTLRQTS